MKKIILDTVIFNPVAKTVQIITDDFDVRKIYTIINQTTSTVLFATGNQNLGYSSVDGNIITLQYDTTGMSSTDTIQIIYEDTEDNELLSSIYEIANRLSVLTAVRGVAADLRTTVVNTVPTTISSGTVTTVSAVTNLSTFNAANTVPNINNTTTVLSNINNISITIT